MKYLITILLAATLFSCITEKQRRDICASCTITSMDSITTNTEVVYRDTTIYITQPGDTIEIQAPFFADKKAFVREKKKDGLVTRVSLKDNKITAECDADSLKLVIEKLTKTTNNSTVNERSKIIVVPQLCEKSSFEKFQLWWFWITAGVCAFLLAQSLKIIPKI